MSDPTCVFCRIARREIKAQIVAETNELLAFADLNPQAPTHLLIVPTEHIPTLADVTEARAPLIGRTIQLANQLAQEHHLTQSGYRLVINCGAGAGQSVFHLHVHLLGGRPMRWPPG